MANLTARADWKESPGNIVEMQVEPDEVIFDGALVGVNSDSTTSNQTMVKKWDADEPELVFLGIARIHYTSANDTGDSVTGAAATLSTATSATTIGVDVSGVVLRQVSLAVDLTTTDQLGELVYGTDDNVITPTANSAGAIGIITKIYSASIVDVKLFTPGEYRAVPVV